MQCFEIDLKIDYYAIKGYLNSKAIQINSFIQETWTDNKTGMFD